jgi:hypothetical protein
VAVEVIEGTPQVVDRVPEDDAEPYRPTFWDLRNAEDMITPLRVELGADVQSFGFVPRSDLGI